MEWIRACAWCKRVESNGQWVVEIIAPDRDNVTHGLCPSCGERVEAEIERMMSEEPPRGRHEE